jgi:hypothetical protein
MSFYADFTERRSFDAGLTRITSSGFDAAPRRWRKCSSSSAWFRSGPPSSHNKEKRRYFCSVEVQLTMTVRGAVAPAFCGLLTRNRWPSLVTAYML